MRRKRHYYVNVLSEGAREFVGARTGARKDTTTSTYSI